MERYTMSSQEGGEGVEKRLMQCTVENFAQSNTVEVQSLGK